MPKSRSRKRLLRYQVAVSLDGIISRQVDDYEWIVHDPTIDFRALYREFDVAVMGRKTYDVAHARGMEGVPGMESVVFSRTLPPVERRGLRITSEDPRDVVAKLKAQPGRDIWLFGGGELFRVLLDADLVDTVELAVIPVLLGEGIPLLPGDADVKLELADVKRLRGSGVMMLAYAVAGHEARPISYVKAARAKGSSRASRASRTGARRRKRR